MHSLASAAMGRKVCMATVVALHLDLGTSTSYPSVLMGYTVSKAAISCWNMATLGRQGLCPKSLHRSLSFPLILVFCGAELSALCHLQQILVQPHPLNYPKFPKMLGGRLWHLPQALYTDIHTLSTLHNICPQIKISKISGYQEP